jgi:hypothetical protein
MAKSSENIVMEMLEFIYREGGHPEAWCVGITNDPRRRLFDEQQVHYQNDAWIYRTAASESEALRVQTYFLEFGLAEGEEGWRPGACMVYAYRRNMHPEPFIKARTQAVRVRGKGDGPRHRSIISATETGQAPERQSHPQSFSPGKGLGPPIDNL